MHQQGIRRPTAAQWAYHADKDRIEGKCGDLLDLLSDREWHRNYQCAEVGGISFHGAIYRLRRAGWIIESRYIQHGQWDYRLTGKTDPPTTDRHMNQTEQRIAVAYTTAIRHAGGTTSLAEVLAALPKWMHASDDACNWDQSVGASR